jgi:hypothetical protein
VGLVPLQGTEERISKENSEIAENSENYYQIIS